MKRLFSSLFGGSSKAEKQEETVRSKYMPAEETPIEEAFTVKFTEQGGKFIYCENNKESVNVFKNILAENGWNDCEMLCFRPKLQERYIRPSITPTKTNLNARFFLTDCEFLVAHDGSIIICAEQIANHKLIDLPENFVIVAGTKQLTDTLSEGLKGIKHKYKKNIPINITSIKHFKKNTTEGDDTFLTYGLPIKHVYLVLIEDF